jgi:hypothetical protein
MAGGGGRAPSDPYAQQRFLLEQERLELEKKAAVSQAKEVELLQRQLQEQNLLQSTQLTQMQQIEQATVQAQQQYNTLLQQTVDAQNQQRYQAEQEAARATSAQNKQQGRVSSILQRATNPVIGAAAQGSRRTSVLQNSTI